jgi:hypothetical protein
VFHLSPAATKYTTADRAAVFSSADQNTQFMTEVDLALMRSTCTLIQ